MKKVSYQKFTDVLQCAITEPGIEGNRGEHKHFFCFGIYNTEIMNIGSLSLLNLIEPSRQTLELICAYIESIVSNSRCLQWKECQHSLKLIHQYFENKTNSDFYIGKIIHFS